MVVLTAGVPARNQPARPTLEHPSDGRWCRNRGRPPSPRAPAASRGRRHLREPADLGELLRLDAGAADQGAVDVRLVHDVGDVGCLDRAAVEDAHPVGQVRRIGVPLAQIGSYAMTTLSTCTGVSPSRAASSCAIECATWSPASRTSRPSPTHRIGASPLARAAFTLALTIASSSWWYARRSECPTTTYWQPSLASIPPEMSPV